nr:unnamed protein product [Callosobruchus chinensis]
MFLNVDNNEDPLFVEEELINNQKQPEDLEGQPDRQNEEETIYSNADQHPTDTIPIVDYAVSQGSNQLIIDTVKYSPAPPKIIILFENKQRIHVQFSENNFEEDFFTFIRGYVAPDVIYHLYYEKPDIYEKFSVVLQRMFNSSSLKFKMCETKLVDVTDK